MNEPTPEMINGSFAVVQDVFRQYRSLILERAGKTKYETKEHDQSLVTETDVEIEKALQAEMKRQVPDMPVFGEETGYDDKLLPAVCWLVDPIDGTKSFVEGIPTFTCMAALIQNGETVASIIYNPSAGDMYAARKDEGAYKNGTRLDLSMAPLPGIALCKELFFDELNGMLESKGVHCEKAPSGGGFGFTMVLDGKAAARFNMHSGGYTHDYAPGGLLVREAGGVLLPILDSDYTFRTRSFVACHPDLEETIRPYLPKLRELDAKNGAINN